MKSLLLSLTIGAAAISAEAAVPASQYIDHISSLTHYHGNVTYSVLLPQAEDPVVYNIDLRSTVSPGDVLAPCRYLIEWDMRPSDDADITSSGFSAYLDGSHYRYRDNRLQEYHMSWDSIPFIIANGGVQCNAQFTDVLPQFLGRELNRLVADTNFVYTWTPDTLYNGRHVAVLSGRQLYHGYVSKEATYIFDPATLMPLAIELENNPGSISEQTVTISYTDNSTETFPIATEEDLMTRYPEVFEKYRESNFRVENLPGTQLPTFSAPALGGERYSYNRGDRPGTPLVIAIVDATVANTPATIEAVRNAAATSPTAFDVIIAFVTSDAEQASEIAGKPRRGETILTGARALARDCGVTACPTLLYVDSRGTVTDVTLGHSNTLTDTIIQTVYPMH
ncbi:MAG: hypothetical protein K2M68_07875 [Muribaculaceae bacterium]|nr:hypothetical protein [Muribaculaceae bacterium]